MPPYDHGSHSPIAGPIKVTRADGTVVVQQPKGARRRQPANALQRAVFARDGLRCRYCGFSRSDVKFFQIDHVIPISKGGCDELENLVVACKRCNQVKRDQVWEPVARPRWKEYKSTIAGQIPKKHRDKRAAAMKRAREAKKTNGTSTAERQRYDRHHT